ncbi:benzoate-CoA ligase family protein [bacterium]|nr:MAG: benzoate-CoA ligase family protein [bacterium]
MTSTVDTPAVPAGSGASAQAKIAASLYNAAADLIDRNLPARAQKIAFVDDAGTYTYGELAQRVGRCSNALRAQGIEIEHRVVVCVLDGIDFPVAFLGAIKAGIVPIPTNTLLTPTDYAYILADSRARAAIVSAELLPQFREAAELAQWQGRIIVSDPNGRLSANATPTFAQLLKRAEPDAPTAPTRRDDICFWLYSSGSTGAPKGTVHVQTSLTQTAELFAQHVLGFTDNDVVYSAAKLFFAYGLGNALTFPLAVGATSVLFAGRPTPDNVNAVLRDRKPTIFCGVPTLFSNMLAHDGLPARADLALRLCTSAGEALPEEIGRTWTARTGVEIIDGIGSTEMLHIFVSNRPGAVRYGTTGRAVPGYQVRLVDADRKPVEAGEIGELEVRGPSAAAFYWNNREKTRATFLGEWLRTGDKFRMTADGDLVHCGRADDMLKVGGIWVSPVEVEGTLQKHEAVLEAAVIGVTDDNGMVKPKAFIVLKPGVAEHPELASELKLFVKSQLAPYKYPRWIEFVKELPKTSTGKTKRHLLRERENELRARQPVQA